MIQSDVGGDMFEAPRDPPGDSFGILDMEILHVDHAGRDGKSVGQRRHEFQFRHLPVGEFEHQYIAGQRPDGVQHRPDAAVGERPAGIVAEADMNNALRRDSLQAAADCVRAFCEKEKPVRRARQAGFVDLDQGCAGLDKGGRLGTDDCRQPVQDGVTAVAVQLDCLDEGQRAWESRP